MESCPHCHFLIRDDARECGVCHRPRVIAVSDGAYVVDSVRVGAGRATGIPVAVVVLMLLVVLLGVGVGAATMVWS